MMLESRAVVGCPFAQGSLFPCAGMAERLGVAKGHEWLTGEEHLRGRLGGTPTLRGDEVVGLGRDGLGRIACRPSAEIPGTRLWS